MKQYYSLRHLSVLCLLCALSAAARADREVNQLQFGKQLIEVATDEVITFYDPWGTANIVDNNSYNAQSLTVFKPVEAGMSVQITFEKIDLKQYSASYFLYMNLYDGVADANDAFSWAESTSSIYSTSSLDGMDGTLLAEKINNDNKPSLPATYTSGTADGALSVGFMHRNSNPCEGWVAKVKVVKLENLTVTGAGSSYDAVVASPKSKQNVALAQAYVTATGVMNPDHVTGIMFTLPQNEGMVNPTSLKLYKGDKQVNSTITAAGEGYLMALDEALNDGTTTFTLRGDIQGTAAVGAKVEVAVTGVITTNYTEGIAPFTAGTPVTVVNPAIVLLTADASSVTVGETPLQFFDEGGADGGIQAKTNGQVTFVPDAAGRKVMINFTKNAIWHGSYYNQELRIYNGTAATAENLIRTLQQGETGIVRSTAADGALTVVLFSDALSSTTAADGFEATVSLFTPQPMDFDGLAVAQYTTGTVCAGDASQRILDINVKTQNTEPAMQLTKMAFTTNGTYAIVTHATLFAGEKMVGETDVTGDAFEISPTEALPLVEGDNNFYLAYTVNDEAQNDQTIDAALISVTAWVNGAEKTEMATEGNPEGVRTVENIVLSQANQGTVTKTVNGAIAFNTKDKSEYSTDCEAGTDNRINTFVPKHEGMVAQIEFSEFNVQYSSSSWGNKSTFKVYSGQGTDGTLLWELNDNAQESVGPGEILRSTAADGSLTVVFNPGTSYSYYYKGWKATVSEYQQKDMQIAAVEVEQASTAIASIGAADQALLNINVKADGALHPFQLSSVKVNLKGTEANITNVSVWQNDTKLGAAVADAEVEVLFAEPVMLTEGNNFFVVKADVSSEAVAEQTIDAKVVSVNIGATETAVENGDPEGSRTLKNIYLLQSGDNGEMIVSADQPIMFYDDGGAEANASANFSGTITFVPKEPADAIKLDFKSWNVYYTTKLNIYQKGSAEGDYDVQYSMYDKVIENGPITSQSEDGKLTVQFTTGSSGPEGFAIEVSAYTKEPVAVKCVTTEDISTIEVLKGQTDTRMLKIAVEAEGELGSVDVTGFTFADSQNDAVSAYHIYQTGTTDGFSANQPFNEKYTISAPGTYYFWLTYDLMADAAVGETATAQLSSITVGEEIVAVSDEEPVIATITVASGKSGTYTVGGENATYATIQGAIDDIGTLGMEGPVVLNIRAGEYNERVRIPYIKGMGSTNTLTIQSESGLRDVKIYHNSYTSGGYSDDQYSKVYGVVTFYEANYVTLKGVEVTTTDQSYDAVVMVKNESRHVTLDNCYIHAATTTSYQQDINLVGHYAQDEENKNNDYLTVKNCLLEGGYIGVNMGGTSYVRLPKEIGGVIEGNTFKNQGSKAIYVMDELGAKIRNNTVILTADAESNMTLGALDTQLRDEYTESMEITGNVFNLAPNKYTTAIYLRKMTGTADAPVIVANNVVNVTSLNASYGGIKLSDAEISNVNIANNTIRLKGENTGAAFWMLKTLTGENVNVVNNIIQNEGSGYAVNLFNDANLTKVNFQNNLMYTAGTTFFRASSGNDGDFNTFVEVTGATGCINKSAVFVDDDILEPSSTLDGDLLSALPLSYVTTDVNGTERPAENISVGAYEYDPDLTRIPVIAENYPNVTVLDWHTAMLSVKTDMNGKAYAAVLRADAPALSAEELKTVGTSFTLTKDTEASVKIDTLQEKTDYIAYLSAVSPRGNATELIVTDIFTTPMEPIDLLIACTEPVTTVQTGTEAALKVMVASGLAPFIVSWTDSKNQPVCEPFQTDLLGEEILTPLAAIQSGDYYVAITDAQQKTALDTCRIVVTGAAQIADFENLYLADNGHWCGPDTKGSMEEGLYGDDQYQGSFISGSYAFSNNYSIDWGSWSGFSYSNSTRSDFHSYVTDQWNACTGSGHQGSENYAVFFEDSFAPMTVTVLNRPDGDLVRGFYITNAAWTVDAILNGDGQTGEKDADGKPVDGTVGFKQGDYFLLTITADNDEEVEFYLADYRSENAADHYYVSDWQWVDLSGLGVVKELTFSLKSSRKNTWGYTTPLYFCMDDFNGYGPGPATMEDLALEEESFWNGSDAAGSFVSGAYRFDNGYKTNSYGNYSYGFAYSNRTSTAFSTYAADRYNACVGEGAEGSATYAVFCMNKALPMGVEVMSSEAGDIVSGFYVTNAASTYQALTEGTDLAKRFGVGDWLKLTVTGYDAEGAETGSVDYYLADFRDANATYIVETWRWVDLSGLGKVKRLTFTMSSSDSNAWGMNTPAYFCLDNLGGEKPEYEEPLVTSICLVKTDRTAEPVAIYSLGGVLQNELLPGINIVKYADGTEKKIFVK